MRCILKPYLLTALLLVLTSQTVADALYELNVEIEKVSASQGHILLALYAVDEAASWSDSPMQKHAFAVTEAVDGRLGYTIKALSAGTYAIRLFQDVNDNQRLDMAENGFPLEAFAFSGVSGGVGIPRIEQATFNVPLAETRLILSLKHPPKEKKKGKNP